MAISRKLEQKRFERDYSQFLESKRKTITPAGFDVASDQLNPYLMEFQKDITKWALSLGKAAIFAGCGMGKTIMQLSWADCISKKTSKPILILAPLAVAKQTVQEGKKFGIDVKYLRTDSGVDVEGIVITNYEMMDRFDLSKYAGIVLDESSILKSYSGKTRNQIILSCAEIPYRLACSATPSPNDYMELGNHSEFLGQMSRSEMLAMFFVHDGANTSKWRLKGHAQDDFWRWICSWAVMLEKPSDLGYDDGKFILPPLNYEAHVVEGTHEPNEGDLFALEALTLIERRRARKRSTRERVQVAADLANNSTEPWVLWCDLNAEGDLLASLIPDAVQIKGADSLDHKEKASLGFANGDIRVLVSKPSICGFGMNFQVCRNMAFVGLSDSFEKYYQATRRCWRYGQELPVYIHIITDRLEGAVINNIQRKEKDAKAMRDSMLKHIDVDQSVGCKRTSKSKYQTNVVEGERWTAHLGDCVETSLSIPSESIDYSIFSPPFASLYTYSDSERDMGNVTSDAEFERHFQFMIDQLLRVTKPGRLVSFHCMNLPIVKERDGFIGLRDFRGHLIKMFQDAGFIYHSEVCIWKDPVTAMQRTKALGLLYKQIKKDSCMSRQGIADYLVTMRKHGINPSPATKDPEDFPVDVWQRFASPVWMDINPSDTLQKESAREEKDERHICPLQLQVIRRAVRLWTNPDDLVFSPFMGIGSEGFVSLKMGRRFIGIELKQSYFDQAIENLAIAAGEKYHQLELNQ